MAFVEKLARCRYRPRRQMLSAILVMVLFLVLPLAAAAAVVVCRRESLWLRILLGLAVLGITAAVMIVVFSVAVSPVFDWNGAKLAPIVAMVKAEPHYALYQPRDTGVMTAWIYGPVPALMFLPSAIASRPTGIIVIGAIINLLCVLVPSFWLIWRVAPRTPNGRLMALLAMGVLLWISISHESLRRATYMVGPDGPALGFAVLSITLLIGRLGWLELSLSAVCAVLSCWCKQTMIPFLLAPPLLFLLIDRKAMLRYLALLGGALVVVSTILILSFAADNMWFHMVTISKSHGWQQPDSRIGSLWIALREMLVDAAEIVVLLLGVWLIVHLDGGTRGLFNRTECKAWINQNRWIILLAAGVLLVPSSLLGFVKIGGHVNNFALTNYFLALCAACAIAAWIPRLDSTALLTLARAMVCAMLALRGAQFFTAHENVPNFIYRVRHVSDNSQELAYNFAAKHPGVAFFPWNPLSSLLAEKRLYHFEWGLIDRHQGLGTLDANHVLAHVPPDVRMVAFPPGVQSTQSAGLFPEMTMTVTTEDLSGFLIVADPSLSLPQGVRPARALPPNKLPPKTSIRLPGART